MSRNGVPNASRAKESSHGLLSSGPAVQVVDQQVALVLDGQDVAGGEKEAEPVVRSCHLLEDALERRVLMLTAAVGRQPPQAERIL
ncbi:hypothetical protein AB0D27_35020 [Streptomyces sp. NPDC048415]|uniref:hypothetical protein n=1 Tax=Streptomyces sp. NPDC048415 TaxID=3154822 RepID=UPI00342B8807